MREARPICTIALIAVNVAVFVAMVASGVNPTQPAARDLLAWGANFGPLTTDGQWWRLASAMFLHAGAIHLAMNMFVLWQIGPTIERVYGRWRFLVIYLAAGLGGSALRLLVNGNIISVGASGAIFGLFGALLALLLRHRRTLPVEVRRALVRDIGTFVVLNVVLPIAVPNIDIMAHIGGFTAGCLTALPLAGRRRE